MRKLLNPATDALPGETDIIGKICRCSRVGGCRRRSRGAQAHEFRPMQTTEGAGEKVEKKKKNALCGALSGDDFLLLEDAGQRPAVLHAREKRKEWFLSLSTDKNQMDQIMPVA